jgi:tetratricopeptide (TPR) repeat protein
VGGLTQVEPHPLFSCSVGCFVCVSLRALTAVGLRSNKVRRTFPAGGICIAFTLLLLAAPSALLAADLLAADGESPRPSRSETLQRHYDAAHTFYLGGDLERATGEYNAFLAEALQTLAEAHSGAGDFDRSVSLFEHALELAPEDRDLRLDFALSRFQAGKLAEARALAEKVVETEATNSGARSLLGHILFAEGDYKGAREHLEAAVVAAPSFDVGYLLGLTYIKLNDLTRARLLFDDMVTGLGDTAQIHILFGRAYGKGEWEALDNAIAELKKAIAKDAQIREGHYLLGMAYLTRDGESAFPNAVPEFHTELENSPNDPRCHYMLGYIALKRHDPKTAESELKRAVALDPKNPDPLVYLGQLFADAGRDEEAETTMRKSIALSQVGPDDVLISRAHYVLGRILLKKSRKEEGQKELEISKDLRDRERPSDQPRDPSRDPKGHKFAEAGNFSEENDVALPGAPKPASPELLKQAQALDEELKISIADAYNNLGVIAAQKKQFAAATGYFQHASQWNSSLETLDRNWGMAEFYANHYSQAIPLLARHLARQAGDVRVRAALGLSHFMLQDYQKTLDTLRPISSEVDGDPGLSYSYAVSLVKTGDYDEGVRRLKTLDATGAHAAEIHSLLGQAFADQQDYEAAIAEYRKSLAIDPNDSQPHFYNGLALLRAGRTSEAADEFRSSLQLSPGDARAKYHLAYALVQNQQRDEAFALLNQVIQQDPRYADAYYELGKLQLERGDTRAAISSLEAGTKLSPDSEYIHYQLAMAYRRDSRTSDAERELATYQDLKNRHRGRNVSR